MSTDALQQLAESFRHHASPVVQSIAGNIDAYLRGELSEAEFQNQLQIVAIVLSEQQLQRRWNSMFD